MGLHGFEFSSAAPRPRPPTLCLTAIFGKIVRKSLNHVKALMSNPVHYLCSTTIFQHLLQLCTKCLSSQFVVSNFGAPCSKMPFSLTPPSPSVSLVPLYVRMAGLVFLLTCQRGLQGFERNLIQQLSAHIVSELLTLFIEVIYFQDAKTGLHHCAQTIALLSAKRLHVIL